MLEQFLNHINRHKLCTKADPILLAVSGGVDSMVMLHLFIEAGFQVSVAHCNFQLRGKESDGDENFVYHACQELKVPIVVERFDTEAYGWENSLSTQMAARELRYAWFDYLLEENQYQFLATGHHFDDTIETILLNWTRGSSVEGLAGIPVKNNKIIRPLLFATRSQVEKYAAEKGIQWREDQSNLTDDYQRNFIRHQIVPKLKELNPSLETTLHAGLEKIQGDLELIHFQTEEWKKDFLSIEGEKVTIEKKGFDSFQQSAPLLWRCIREYGFNFEQTREIVLVLNGQSGKQFLTPSHKLVIDREKIIITPHVDFWNNTQIKDGQTTAVLGSWNMEIEKLTDVSKSNNVFEAKLDTDKITFPLVWRKWKAGDIFYPLGMEHRKKVSDFLIDNKVPVSDKDVVTVLESNGEIVWVVGYRIDNRFKITPTTTSTLLFTLSPYFT
ncbi:MAG: tRNA lysidine(34) synthetase TilS [Chryseolinea sp.]